MGKRIFALVLYIVVVAAVVEAVLMLATAYQGSPWLPLTWLAHLGSPLLAYPVFNGALALALVAIYAVSLKRKPAVSLYLGAAAWFATLIAVATERGYLSPQDIVAIVIFILVSVAVVVHAGRTLATRR